MPVAARRGLDGRSGYLAIRNHDGDDDGDDEPETANPTVTAFPTATMNMQGKKSEPTDSPILVTMTLTSNGPAETVVVTLPPPPPPPHQHHHGISQTTERLLIAAGSIGATIIVVMIIFVLHTMRKRNITFIEAVKRGKDAARRKSRRGPPPPPKSRNYGTTGHSFARTETVEYGSAKGVAITAVRPAITRTRSDASDQPLMLDRNQSLRESSNRSISPSRSGQRSFLLDSSPKRNRSNASHLRNDSETPSSPVLPLQTQRQSASTRNTRSISDTSDLVYPEPPVTQMEPLPPPPSFRQFLFNRRSVAFPRPPGPMVSRFSWTNSNAPQTPHDPTRDTLASGAPGMPRESIMTSRSSVPRFRTIDSWVDQQASRIEEQKLQEQVRVQNSMLLSQSDDEKDDPIPSVPEVPEIPELPILPLKIQKIKQTEAPVQPTTPSPSGLVGKDIRHARHDTQMTSTTDPIFRQHPGTEVRFSTRSLVPSEILNNKKKLSVLS